jgi:hypothetical protein
VEEGYEYIEEGASQNPAATTSTKAAAARAIARAIPAIAAAIAAASRKKRETRDKGGIYILETIR